MLNKLIFQLKNICQVKMFVKRVFISLGKRRDFSLIKASKKREGMNTTLGLLPWLILMSDITLFDSILRSTG